MLTHLAHSVVELLYPNRCSRCQTPHKGSSPLCGSCQDWLIALESEPACLRCAMPLHEWHAPCPYCLNKGLRPYQHIVRLGRFDGPLKDLIHQLKYQSRWPLAEHLAHRLLARQPVRDLLRESDCLIPIPLHWRRQFTRGYNQSEVIARVLSRWRHLPLLRPAVRLRNTPTQTALHTHVQRAQNLRNAFGLTHPDRLRNQRIVVIDDVMTTGATLRSFARTLRQARPASISAIVLAIADPRGRSFQSI